MAFESVAKTGAHIRVNKLVGFVHSQYREPSYSDRFAELCSQASDWAIESSSEAYSAGGLQPQGTLATTIEQKSSYQECIATPESCTYLGTRHAVFTHQLQQGSLPRSS
ncbi:hypothetical protein CYMTET_53738 [Cymbomonas tetramitiformis]|uniref:Uncharacterized protein n=1 Tax=Cymbomonas tetramitiformis TaxID=36881 RepID=A0AAE0BGF8_9CHLO|nr:hypothetical protein CYMTET_53738 [Cymbomonas tetramitiformis]